MIRIAVIGCGKQAPKHIKGLMSASDTDIVLVDMDETVARNVASEFDLPWTRDLDAVFSDPEVDAIDLCTPTTTHLPLITRTLEAKKDFFCEKPLCESVAEGHRIADLLEKSSQIGMVGYVYRFVPVFEAARTYLSKNLLGPIVSATFRLGGRGGHRLWKHTRETGGGALNEMLVHMMDLAIWYFGPMAETEVLTSKTLRPRRIIQGEETDVDAEDYLVVRAQSESGVEILLQADMVTPAFSQSVEIQGENGTFLGSIQSEKPSFLYLEKDTAGYPAGRTDISNPYVNIFAAQMSEFIRCIQTRQQPEKCNIQDSVLLLQAMEPIKQEVYKCPSVSLKSA